MDAEPTGAELVGVRSALSAASKSLLVILHNRSSQTLELVSAHISHGAWARSPPHRVAPFTAVVLASQANQILRGTEWEVVYCDEQRTPYHLSAENAFTATEPRFQAAVLGRGTDGAEPAELSCSQTEGGAAAEANVFVQRTVARLRIQERTPVSASPDLDAPPVRELLPRHVAEALEVLSVQGTDRVRTKDGWFSLKSSGDLVTLVDRTPSGSADGAQPARLLASPFKLLRESELTAAAAVVCSTPNTGLQLAGLNEGGGSGGSLLGDCVLTASHLFVRPFATHEQDLVFALALVDVIEARALGGGILGLGIIDDLKVELTTAVPGGEDGSAAQQAAGAAAAEGTAAAMASLKFEARWEREDLLQVRNTQQQQPASVSLFFRVF